MRLTVYTDYALRVLMYLAMKEDRLATIAEIAKSYDISRNHLMKVAHQLGVGRLCRNSPRQKWRAAPGQADRSHRARRSGALYRAGHGDRVLFRAARWSLCAIRPICVLKRALNGARDAFLEVLDGYTLADLVEPRARLSALLGIG